MPYQQSEKKRIEAVSMIFQNGKVQVPRSIRISLGVKDGEKIVWLFIEGKWVVEKA